MLEQKGNIYKQMQARTMCTIVFPLTINIKIQARDQSGVKYYITKDRSYFNAVGHIHGHTAQPPALALTLHLHQQYLRKRQTPEVDQTCLLSR